MKFTTESAKEFIKAHPAEHEGCAHLWNIFMHGHPQRYTAPFWTNVSPEIVMARSIYALRLLKEGKEIPLDFIHNYDLRP